LTDWTGFSRKGSNSTGGLLAPQQNILGDCGVKLTGLCRKLFGNLISRNFKIFELMDERLIPSKNKSKWI
jgi:hypothetical protein